jgi:hypothetical protein
MKKLNDEQIFTIDDIIPFKVATNRQHTTTFYINLKTTTHNKIIYERIPCQAFKFVKQDVHSKARPFHFKLIMLPFFTHVVSIMDYYFLKIC